MCAFPQVAAGTISFRTGVMMNFHDQSRYCHPSLIVILSAAKDLFRRGRRSLAYCHPEHSEGSVSPGTEIIAVNPPD